MTIDLKKVRALLDADRRTLSPWGAKAQVLPRVTRMRGLVVDWHNITFSALTSDDAEEVIAAETAHYRSLGCTVEWTVYAHDGPPDLRHRLARYGFEIGPREAVMVLDAEPRPPWLDEPSPYRIERVATSEQLACFQRVAEGVFGGRYGTIVQELAAAIGHATDEHVGYLAFDRERAAAVARMYTRPDRSSFAGLYGGGTLPEHRGRGLYRALVAQRVRDALSAGVRYMRVDALPTSQPILERLGFCELTQAWPCVLRPG
jgi:GNAT superfamily N-acetyltransferase